MNREDLENYLEVAVKASLDASKEILEVYNSAFSLEQKEDKSPLTEADLRSHKAIVSYLDKTPIPVLSEEGREIDFNERSKWNYLWVVDPLDGTKEFIKRNGEFTVNIALVKSGKPLLGVIHVPVSDELYIGIEDLGAFKIKGEDYKDLKSLFQKENKIPNKENRKYTVVGSRSHMSSETEEFISIKKAEKGQVDILSKGSSLKLCMLAEGKADDYPRFAPTMEWDTAAGHAILSAAGGKVINWRTKEDLDYNKENLLNEWFLATI